MEEGVGGALDLTVATLRGVLSLGVAALPEISAWQ